MEDFAAHDVAVARAALREMLGLEPERFGIHQVMDILAYEITALRNAGQSDQAIADLLANATGRAISADDLGVLYEQAS